MKEDTELMEAHHVINGVATDILANAEALVETEKDFETYSKLLSEQCSISIEEAQGLLRLHV